MVAGDRLRDRKCLCEHVLHVLTYVLKQRVLDMYTDANEKGKVDQFLDMVWNDYRRRLELIASLLLREPTLENIATALLRQDASDEEADRRIAEVVVYAGNLLKEDLQRPQAFVTFIPTIIHHCKEGAYGTAVNRLIDHSTVVDQEAHPDLSSEGEKLFKVGDDQTVQRDYGALCRQRILQAAHKRKRDEDGGGPVGDVAGHRRPGAPRANSDEEQQGQEEEGSSE